MGVVVKEAIHAPAKERFEASVRQKVEGLGSVVGPIRYVADDPDAVTEALAGMAGPRGGAGLVLTAGSASTDPTDAFFVAVDDGRRDRPAGRARTSGLDALHGPIGRTMTWSAHVRRLLPGDGGRPAASMAPVRRAAHPGDHRAPLADGGILTRDQRFRFPAYASELEAPEG